MKKTIPFICSIIILLFIVIYFLKFGNFKLELSDKHEDWAHFSTYLGIGLSIVNIIIFYLLTSELHKYNKTKDLEEIRPIISFHLKDGNPYYAVENIGRSAALDIKIKRNYSNKENLWDEGYNYFTLSPGEKIQLIWSHNSMQLCAEYEDRNRKKHYSYMDGNSLRFFDEESGRKLHIEEYNKSKQSIKGEFKSPPPNPTFT